VAPRLPTMPNLGEWDDDLERDCCGCRFSDEFNEYHRRKAPQWLARKIKNVHCCTATTLCWIRFFNFIFLLYGLAVSGFCLLLMYAVDWVPNVFSLSNESILCATDQEFGQENCTRVQVLFSLGGYENLSIGGVIFWGAALLQFTVTFFLSPLPCYGHLNTICCSTRQLPILASASAFLFLLFVAHVALAVLTHVPATIPYFPNWVFTFNMFWVIGMSANALFLLITFGLVESFRTTFLAPTTLVRHGYTPSDPTKNAHGSNRYLDNDKAPSAVVEMVEVGGKEQKEDAEASESKTPPVEGAALAKASHAPPKRSWSDELDTKVDPNEPPPTWEIPPEQIQDGAKIGEGFFGECFKAMWHQQDVVVKRFKNGIRGEGADAARKNFHREVAILVQLRHPRICQFLGACARPDNLFIVLEYMTKGSLQDYLHKRHKPADWVPLNRGQKHRIISDVALGLAYLHKCSPAIIHRDLTSGNVLLDDQFRAKVSDFGLSRPYDYRMTLRPGNRFYMAPELLLGKSSYTTAVDIYSLAIIMWELYSLKRPFSNIAASRMKAEVGLNEVGVTLMQLISCPPPPAHCLRSLCTVMQVRPPLPLPQGLCTPALEDLMALCWHSDESQRPTALSLFGRLQQLEQAESNNGLVAKGGLVRCVAFCLQVLCPRCVLSKCLKCPL